MVNEDKLKKLDEQAYNLIRNKGLDINKTIVEYENVHSNPFIDKAQSYLYETNDWFFSLDEVKRINNIYTNGKDELSKYKNEENTFSSQHYVVFIPALPEEVEQAMNDWYKKYKNYSDLETIIKAEMDLCSIHPFQDGNGRTAYCLLKKMMYSIGYKCALHLDIDKCVYARKKENALAIQASAGRGWGLKDVEYEAYVSFMLEIIETAYNELLLALR